MVQLSLAYSHSLISVPSWIAYLMPKSAIVVVLTMTSRTMASCLFIAVYGTTSLMTVTQNKYKLNMRSNKYCYHIPTTDRIIHAVASEITMVESIKGYGWTAVSRDPSIFLASRDNSKEPATQSIQDIHQPQTALANAVTAYAKRELSEQTFNHSMRVYYYGKLIPNSISCFSNFRPLLYPQHYTCTLLAYSDTGKAISNDYFSTAGLSDETYLLACLLHDIGTTDKHLHATLMSFEFYGGFLALRLLQDELKAPKEQAESVTEAIIRHQDLGESGKITMLGQILQLATVFGKDHFSFHYELAVVSMLTSEQRQHRQPRRAST